MHLFGQSAIAIINQHDLIFTNVRETLYECVLKDKDENVRGEAFLALARIIPRWPEARTLASRDLDGLSPGLDPLRPRAEGFVNRAAERLGKTPGEICDLYQRLGSELDLPLAIAY